MTPVAELGKRLRGFHSIVGSEGQTFFDITDPSQPMADALVLGPERNYRLNDANSGPVMMDLKTSRRGEIIFTRDDNTQLTRCLPFDPLIHPSPSATINYTQARALPRADERRSFATALHDRHARVHITVVFQARVDHRGFRKLGLGGFQPGSTLGRYYQNLRELAEIKEQEAAARPRDQDLNPEIPF